MSQLVKRPSRGGSPISEEWIVLLEAATREVFEIMVGAKVQPVPESDPPPPFNLTAMIGLAGELCGVLSIRLERATAARIASMMLDGEVQQGDQSVHDAMGEIANMVAGNFKAKITRLADRCHLSVPTVISGTDYNMVSLVDGGSAVVSIHFEGAPVWVILDVQS